MLWATHHHYKWMSNTPSSTVCTSSSRISVGEGGAGGCSSQGLPLGPSASSSPAPPIGGTQPIPEADPSTKNQFIERPKGPMFEVPLSFHFATASAADLSVQFA